MVYKPSQRNEAIIFLDKMFEKNKWVKIDHIPQNKSLSQNNYLWLVFTVIAQDTGNSPQDIYEYYLEKFPVFKEIQIHGEEKSVRISLSSFNFDQCSTFIDRVVIDARSEGFIIPDPKDKEALDQYNYYKQRGIL